MNKTKAEKYIGMTNTMKCGMKATIIAYRGCADIDIRFENGTVRKHMKTNCFRQGDIAPTPMNKKTHYIGQTRRMNCGLNATVIVYRGYNDIDVQFENGTIRKHKSIKSFENCKISPTQFGTKTYHIGKTNTMKCGMNATIIAYRGCKDIDVQCESIT